VLPAGLLGDRYGHKRVFLISLALFAVGSAACAFSTTVAEFMAARVLLGLAGAGGDHDVDLLTHRALQSGRAA
jgi:DHA2 family multidrug resistance protein-like MFS transporter